MTRDVIPVLIPPLELRGDLCLPSQPRGVVIFAHGSGSSRLSPRNQLAASKFNDAAIATLLFDLLTEEEAQTRANVFDIPLLARRLEDAIDWVCRHPDLGDLPIGLFGASTGAAAALTAAAKRPDAISAVVSRGGRPDLAGTALGSVQAPVLLVVGARDQLVLELNREAERALGHLAQLRIIPGATHLFEESGALEAAIQLAIDWFATAFARQQGRRAPKSVKKGG